MYELFERPRVMYANLAFLKPQEQRILFCKSLVKLISQHASGCSLDLILAEQQLEPVRLHAQR